MRRSHNQVGQPFRAVIGPEEPTYKMRALGAHHTDEDSNSFNRQRKRTRVHPRLTVKRHENMTRVMNDQGGVVT